MGPICRQHGKLGDTVAGKFDSLASEINRLPSPRLPSDLVPPKPSPPSNMAIRRSRQSDFSNLPRLYWFCQRIVSIYLKPTKTIPFRAGCGRGYSTFTMWTFLMTRWTASSSNWVLPSCDRNCLHNRNGESNICQLYTLDWIFGVFVTTRWVLLFQCHSKFQVKITPIVPIGLDYTKPDVHLSLACKIPRFFLL